MIDDDDAGGVNRLMAWPLRVEYAWWWWSSGGALVQLQGESALLLKK
jgi:hypothetical protein